MTEKAEEHNVRKAEIGEIGEKEKAEKVARL